LTIVLVWDAGRFYFIFKGTPSWIFKKRFAVLAPLEPILMVMRVRIGEALKMA
jgi:hypothetical protein